MQVDISANALNKKWNKTDPIKKETPKATNLHISKSSPYLHCRCSTWNQKMAATTAKENVITISLQLTFSECPKTLKLENLIVGLKFSVYPTLGPAVVISYFGKISPSLAHWIIIIFNVRNKVKIQSSNLKIRKFQMNGTLITSPITVHHENKAESKILRF